MEAKNHKNTQRKNSRVFAGGYFFEPRPRLPILLLPLSCGRLRRRHGRLGPRAVQRTAASVRSRAYLSGRSSRLRKGVRGCAIGTSGSGFGALNSGAYRTNGRRPWEIGKHTLGARSVPTAGTDFGEKTHIKAVRQNATPAREEGDRRGDKPLFFLFFFLCVDKRAGIQLAIFLCVSRAATLSNFAHQKSGLTPATNSRRKNGKN